MLFAKLAVVIPIIYCAHASAASCDLSLRRPSYRAVPNGNQFSDKTLGVYLKRRRLLPPPKDWILAGPGEPAVELLMDLAKDLADAAGLARNFSKPYGLEVYIRRSGKVTAFEEAGIIQIGQALIELAQNDDDLAAMIGAPLLSHLLAHTQRSIAADQTWFGGFLYHHARPPGVFARQNWISVIKGSLDERRNTRFGAEVEAGLADALAAAGYDAWAMVRVRDARLRAVMGSAEPFTEASTLASWEKETESIQNTIRRGGILPKSGLSATTRLDALRSALKE